jgi:hypothetical protein
VIYNGLVDKKYEGKKGELARPPDQLDGMMGIRRRWIGVFANLSKFSSVARECHSEVDGYDIVAAALRPKIRRGDGVAWDDKGCAIAVLVAGDGLSVGDLLLLY